MKIYRHLYIILTTVVLSMLFFLMTGCGLLDENDVSEKHSGAVLNKPEGQPSQSVGFNTDGPASCSGDPGIKKERPWNLILVNAENPIPQDFSVELEQLINNQSVDKRCYPDLQKMMDDCRAAGLKPLICSSYRTREYQSGLFEKEINYFKSFGFTDEKAREKAAQQVQPPGLSEHHTGLAVDIVDRNYQLLDKSQENTPVQKWLMENCYKYGFILRYPSGKSDITGIIYEPWHYRYVGREAAEEIRKLGVCLEEYLEITE